MKEDSLSIVTEYWAQATVFSNAQEQQWAANEALVSGRHLTARKAGRSSIFVPKIPSYAKRKLADFVGQFVGDSPVTIKNSLTASSVGAKIKQKVHNYYVRKLNYEALIYNAAYSGIVYNYAPILLDWVEEIETEKVKQQTGMPDGSIVEEEVEVESIVDSYPVASVLPPEAVRVDTSVAWDNIDEARYIAYEVPMSASDADANVRSGKWPEIDSEWLEFESDKSPLPIERRSKASPFSRYTSMDMDNNLLPIRYHYFFEERKGGYIPVKCVTLGDQMVLEKPEPLEINWGGDRHAWPFVIGIVYPKPF